MRLLTLSLAFICNALLVSTASGQAKSDRERDGLVGPVQSVLLELVELSTGSGKEVEIRRRPHQLVAYNERGSEIERVNFNKDGSISDKSVLLYDSAGKQIGSRAYRNTDSQPISTSTWRYDANGNLAEVRVHDQGVLELLMVYTYDNHRRKVEESRFGDDGAFRDRDVYAYNAAGQLVETAYYHNEVLTGKVHRKYNETGSLMKETQFNIVHPESTVEYVYDSSGREIEQRVDTEILWSKVQTSYDRNGRVAMRETSMGYKHANVYVTHAPEPGQVVFRYDDRGKVVEEISYSPDRAIISKTVSIYNQAGALIEQVYSRRDNNGGKVSFEYDATGNWIKATKSSTDNTKRQTVHVEYRTIGYY